MKADIYILILSFEYTQSILGSISLFTSFIFMTGKIDILCIRVLLVCVTAGFSEISVLNKFLFKFLFSSLEVSELFLLFSIISLCFLKFLDSAFLPTFSIFF